MSFEKNAKTFLQKLGVKASELEAENADIAAIVSRIETGIIDNNRDDIEANAKTTAATAAYNKVAKQLAAKFDLDYSKYQTLSKGQFEAVLKDAAEAFEAKAAETTNAGKGKGDADVATLKTQLAELQNMHKAALEENNKYKAELEALPQQLEAAKESVIVQYETDSQLKSAISQLRKDGLNPILDDEMILSKFKTTAQIKAVKSDNGYSYQITDAQGKPIKKSATEAYNDAYSFMRDKVVKEEWIVKSAETGAGSTGVGAGAGSGASAGKKVADKDLSKNLPSFFIE